MASYNAAGRKSPWENPPDDQFAAAAARDPAGAAAVQGLRMGSATGMNQGAYGAAAQKSYDQRNIQSGTYNKGVDQATSGANGAWYGQGNEYGMSLMAGDSDAFWT